MSQRTHIGGIPLSYLSLATLAIQNAALILVMHYSRVMPITGSHQYFTSTAVLLNEVLKLAIALAVALYDVKMESSEASYFNLRNWRTLYDQVFSGDSWKLAIPAALYTIQNSLQYIAVSNLDAATFQVTYQSKILTTAIFSVTMLGRSLSLKKWLSLVILMFGVGISQLPSNVSSSQKTARAVAEHAEMNRFVGLMAVFIACAISGLAGVYFEKVLKDGKKATVWVRNVQLSFFSIIPAILGVLLKDGGAIAEYGFFAGYNSVVWTAIVFQAVGGLLVALVVNYADNIAKNFATSISIIISFFASVYLFDFPITITFLVGMAAVLYATFLYSSPDRKTPSKPVEPLLETHPDDEESTYYDNERITVTQEKLG
ncbi:uncharacterized protein PV09_06975 [Verruconis gallopava]|uniref:UDP-galactose transporter n=1 Tax=Verruconis gallopava TaxID=253628 RepID=A0A0D2A4V0_9PEZI|nr:uncharacterized protein PV09_06975 [Verruconis gallopava]KIW01495.1 hypothetical protein PV09_06975 [Verruconis gallopava]